MNKIVLMGRLTKDLEKRTTPSGVSVMNNTLAVDRDFRNGDEKQTDFIDIVVWRHNADFLERYSGKGRMIVVSGSLQSRKWEDKDGKKRTSWEVVVDNVYFADSKRDGQNVDDSHYQAPTPESFAAARANFKELPDSGEDLPF